MYLLLQICLARHPQSPAQAGMALSVPWGWQGTAGCVPQHISCQALIRCAFIHGCVLTTGHMRGPAWPTWEQRKRGVAWQHLCCWEERLCLAVLEPFGVLQRLGTLWDPIPALLGVAWEICPFVTDSQAGLG